MKEKTKLFCWYESKIHPTWAIGPLKAEMLTLFPQSEVVQYHDVLTANIVANLKEIVPPEAFIKAHTGGKTLSGRKRLADSKTRLASIAWIPEKDFPISMNISKLTERITGLKVVGADNEDLQVGGYTPGGHYKEHPDSVRPNIVMHLEQVNHRIYWHK